MKCSHCHSELQGRFCSKCGQEHTDKKITLGLIFRDILGSFFNVERGLLATYWGLIVKPKEVIERYIQGDRRIYFNPYRLMLVSLTIWALSYFLMKDFLTDVLSQSGYYQLLGIKGYEKIVNEVLLVIVLPFISFGYYLLFRKFKKSSYIEMLSINVYLFACTMIWNVIPLNIALKLGMNFYVYYGVSMGLSLLYDTYCLRQYFGISWTATGWRVLVGSLFGMGIFSVLNIVITTIYIMIKIMLQST